jgi:hypothetical protein
MAALVSVGLFLTVLLRAQTPAKASDVVGQLAQRLASGDASLEYQGRWGYLESLLKALDINLDSQVLVFSRTSLQQEHIGPKTPRALFFNDTVSVGSVQGGALYEITVAAEDNGVHFYTIGTQQVERPKIESDDGLCIVCHSAAYAGHTFVANTYPDEDGSPAYLGGDLFHVTDHRTPFEERWGGWYVSGTHGKMKHLGNAVAHNPYRPVELETEGTQNLTSLEKKFDVKPYLSPVSDIVALLTLEHQTRALYYMAALSAQFRLAGSKTLLKKPVLEPQLEAAVQNLVSYLTFADEAPLTDPVKGVSTFTQTFPLRGPRDGNDRSLRDFNLKTRVFQYPLSFTIYTDVFDRMHSAAKERVLRGLFDALKSHGADGRAAIEILRETKPELPEYFK